MRRALAVLLLAVLPAGIAACGDDGDKESSTDTTARGRTATSVDTDFSGKGSSTFCKALRKYSQETKDNNLTATDPKELKATYDKVGEIAADLKSKAPSEIKNDINVLAGALTLLVNELKAANYDFTKLDTKKLAVLNSAEYTQASTRLTAYEKDVCGIDESATTTTAKP